MSEVLTISIALFVILFVYLRATRPSSGTSTGGRPATDRRHYYLTPEEREHALKRLRTVDARVIRLAAIEDVRKWDNFKFTMLFDFQREIFTWDDLTDSQIEDAIHVGAPMVQKAGHTPF